MILSLSHNQVNVINKQPRIVLLGMQGSGKTSITTRFIIDEYSPNRWDDNDVDYDCEIRINGIRYLMNIADTATPPQYITAHYHDPTRDATALVLVYSVANKRSFEHVQHLMKQAVALREAEESWRRVSILQLVGNQSDVATSMRKVSFEIGQELADKYGVPFSETSAKIGENVDEMFEMLMERILEQKIVEYTEVLEDEKQKCCILL